MNRHCLPPNNRLQQAIIIQIRDFIFKRSHKRLCWSLFLIKLHAFRPANLFKKVLRRCFPVNTDNFSRTPILKNISRRLLLDLQMSVSGLSNQWWEAVVRMCSVKMVFLEISQNSLENTCARVSFLIKSLNFVKFLRTPFYIEHPWWLLLSQSIYGFWKHHKIMTLSLKKCLPFKCPYDSEVLDIGLW